MDSAAASETRDFLTRNATDHLSHNTRSFAPINRSDSLSCGWGILSVSSRGYFLLHNGSLQVDRGCNLWQAQRQDHSGTLRNGVIRSGSLRARTERQRRTLDSFSETRD